MRLAQILWNNCIQTVMKQGNNLAMLDQSLEDLLENGLTVEPRPIQLAEAELNFLPVIRQPEKIICVGLNYREHAAETQMAVPEAPVLFSKFNNALTGHGCAIKLSETVTQLDYEGELVIVMGKAAANVSEEQALDYVFGYTIGNDISARNLQFKTSQWLLGKTLAGFAPLGPWLVTREELGNPDNLKLITYVNDRVVQQGNTRDMIFSCKTLISYLSRHFVLKPGDLIFTGTPPGVIMGLPPEQQVWLKSGDKVTVEIEGIGKLTNIVY